MIYFPINSFNESSRRRAAAAAPRRRQPTSQTNDIVRKSMEVIMYFKFRDNGYCINCDWLQYSVYLDTVTPKIECPEGYRVELCQGNNIFEHRALVFDKNGRKVLTLLWKPYSSVIDPHIMTVQVGNECLYNGFILKSLELVKSITKCLFNSVGRFDICCDFLMTERKFEMVKHLNSGRYYVERKAEGSAFWHEVNENGFKRKKTHCISWGSKHSEIKVKLYNKSREIGLLGGGEPQKPWIVKEWETIGLDKLSVWRLEFSMSSNGQLRWNDQPIQLDNIASPSWLMRVFFDLYFARFVCRVNEGKKKGHHNEDRRVFIIDLPKDGEKLTWKTNENKQLEAMPAVALLRSLMRNLENEALLADKSLTQQYCNTIIDVVNTHYLGEYFERTFQTDPITFTDDVIQKAGATVTTQIANVNKLMN